MPKAKTRLSKVSWIKAGYRALTTEGPAALKAEKLARAIGTTKGSFYWHFRDLADFKTQMLEHWLAQAYSGVTERLDTAQPPKEQLVQLMVVAAESPDDYGGTAAEPAIRAWARSDPQVAEAVATIDKNRLAFLVSLMEGTQEDVSTKAHLLYGALIGLQELSPPEQEFRAHALKTLAETLLD